MGRCDLCIKKFPDNELFTVIFEKNDYPRTYCKDHIRQVLTDMKKTPWHKGDKIYRTGERSFEFRASE